MNGERAGRTIKTSHAHPPHPPPPHSSNVRKMVHAVLKQSADDAERAAAIADRRARLAPVVVEAAAAGTPAAPSQHTDTLTTAAGDLVVAGARSDEPLVRCCVRAEEGVRWPDAERLQRALEGLGAALGGCSDGDAATALARAALAARALTHLPCPPPALPPLFELAVSGDAALATPALAALRAAWGAQGAWTPPDTALPAALAAAGVVVDEDAPWVPVSRCPVDGSALARRPGLRVALAAVAAAASASRARGAPRDADALVSAFAAVHALTADPVARVLPLELADAATSLLNAVPAAAWRGGAAAAAARVVAGAATHTALPAARLDSVRRLPRLGGPRVDAVRVAAAFFVAAAVGGGAPPSLQAAAADDGGVSAAADALLSARWFTGGGGDTTAAAATALVNGRGAGPTPASADAARVVLEAADEGVWPGLAARASGTKATARALAGFAAAVNAAVGRGGGMSEGERLLQVTAADAVQRYDIALEGWE